jgi:hypothetical protein
MPRCWRLFTRALLELSELTHFFPSLIADAHKLSAKVKSELPGRGQEAEAKAGQYGAEAGAKFDNAVSHFFVLV